MRCIVKRDLPFAKVGEEVEVRENKLAIVDKDGRWQMWRIGWGDMFADGWLAEKKPTRWFPNDGDSYWFVNTSLVPAQTKYHFKNDEARVAIGNAFSTEEEAMALAKRLRNCAQAYNMELEAASVGRKADLSSAASNCPGPKVCKKNICENFHTI